MPDATHPRAAQAPDEPALTFWDKRVDAMDSLLCRRVPQRYSVERHRRAVEALPPERYARLSHYERWVEALRETVVQAGLLDATEIEARVAAIRRRAGRSD